MPQKKSFPLRVNGEILDAIKRWSADELRSVNAQIEWVLRDALRRSGRLPRPGRDREDAGDGSSGGPHARGQSRRAD